MATTKRDLTDRQVQGRQLTLVRTTSCPSTRSHDASISPNDAVRVALQGHGTTGSPDRQAPALRLERRAGVARGAAIELISTTSRRRLAVASCYLNM